MGLSCGIICVILGLAILIQFQSVTDRQTDTHTDRYTTTAYIALSIASRSKNVTDTHSACARLILEVSIDTAAAIEVPVSVKLKFHGTDTDTDTDNVTDFLADFRRRARRCRPTDAARAASSACHEPTDSSANFCPTRAFPREDVRWVCARVHVYVYCT